MCKPILLVALIATWILGHPAVSEALIIREYDYDRHRRYELIVPEGLSYALNNATAIDRLPTFFAHDYDWSGYGWGVKNNRTGATLISPRHYLTSIHAPTEFNSSGFDVAFANTAGEIFKYEIDHFDILVPQTGKTVGSQPSNATIPIGQWHDLVLVTLAEPVDSSIHPFRLVDDPAWLVDQVMILASQQTSGYRSAGRNRIQTYAAAPGGDPFTYPGAERLSIDYDEIFNDPGVDGDEAKGENGDSGNPWFSEFNGELILGGLFYTGQSASSVGGPIAQIIQGHVWDELPEYNLRYGHPEADFTGDNVISAADIDALFAAVDNALNGVTDLTFDITGDNIVDQDDANWLVLMIIGTVFGDADLDGDVDSADLVILAEHYDLSGGWADGDFDGTFTISLGDLTIIAANFGYAGGLNPIPEPAALTFMALAIVGSTFPGRRSRVQFKGE